VVSRLIANTARHTVTRIANRRRELRDDIGTAPPNDVDGDNIEEVDTVNILPRGSSRPYHHGQLRDSLVDAGLQLARAQGPDAVRLRAGRCG
jgi:hypothetical protein